MADSPQENGCILVNKVTELILENEGDKEATYFDLIKHCLNRKAIGGFTIEEMRNRLDLLQKINDAPDTPDYELSLLPREVHTLKQVVHEMDGHWVILHHCIVNFAEYIADLKCTKQ